MPTQPTLPDYNSVLADFLNKLDDTSDVQFPGVTTQVFPLRADIDVLRKFCDDNLNRLSDSPPPPIKIDPVAPWVLMQVCNYNFMGQAQGKGYVSQHEVAFGFPVTWQQTEGQKTAREFAMFYPFIFVDNSISLTLGRQVYGWAKAGVEVDRRLPNFDPRDPIVLSISRKRYRQEESDDARYKAEYKSVQRLYNDEGISENLLRVLQKQGFTSTWPGLDLIMLWPRMVGSFLNAAAGVFDTAGRTLSGFAPADLPSLGRDLQSLGDIMIRWYAYMNDFAPALFGAVGVRAGNGGASSRVPILTLKQIRDTDDTSTACYLATIRSQISVDSVKSGGILFNPAVADLSGGIQINLFRTDEEPIVEQLGILSSGKVKIDDSKQGKIADVIQPVMPFWAQADVSYSVAADYQLSRTKWTPWSAKGGLVIPHRGDVTNPIVYRHYGSGTGGEVQGPIRSDNFVLHVYPFVVDQDNLQKLVDDYLQPPVKLSVTDLQGGKSLVFMLVSSFKKVSDNTQELLTEDKVVTFAVPVTYQGQTDAKQTLVHLYSFAHTDWTVITDNEVYGRFTIKSTLDAPGSLWIDSHSKTPQELLTVATWVFTDPNSDQQPQLLPIIEIYEDTREAKSSSGSERTELGNLEPSQLLSIYKKLLGFDSDEVESFFILALKQVRDAQAVSSAALQSIVGVRRSVVNQVSQDDKLAGRVKVVISDYPGLAMGLKLGLAQVLFPEDRTGGPVTIFSEPGTLFWGTMTESPAETLYYRLDNGDWQHGGVDLSLL
jgi:hypothetical protein